MIYKLKSLVIKPILSCTANCPTCVLRMDLFKDRKSQNTLSLDVWRKIIDDAAMLGCIDFTISGGEPLLYDDLPELIACAARNEMVSNLNTNGSLVTLENSLAFSMAGLTNATISVYSHDSKLHDQMRHENGLFAKAINAIRFLRVQKNIVIYLQTILTNYNIEDFDKFIAMAYKLDVNYICVSYLEGDMSGKFLPSLEQINRFKNLTALRAIDVVSKNSSGKVADEAMQQINLMFANDAVGNLAFSQGEYGKTGKKYCPIPYGFALILADGDVLPCNGIEYAHEPIMGNINSTPLHEIWTSEKWGKYRKERYGWCDKCPMTLHFKIPIFPVENFSS